VEVKPNFTRQSKILIEHKSNSPNNIGSNVANIGSTNPRIEGDKHKANADPDRHLRESDLRNSFNTSFGDISRQLTEMTNLMTLQVERLNRMEKIVHFIKNKGVSLPLNNKYEIQTL